MLSKKLWVVCLVAGVLSGCVSQSKYQSLETRTAAERAALEKELNGLRAQKQELEKQRTALERSLTGLRDEMSRRESELADVNKQVEAQMKEREALGERLAEMEKRAAEMEQRALETEKRASELAAQKDAEINRLRGTYDDLVKDLKGEIAKGEIKVKQFRDKLSVQLVEKILFDSGKADIKPEGREVLAKVANVLRNITDKQIRIEGYTDSVPIRGTLRRQFATNWELSTQRATTVLRFLQDKGGIDGRHLSAVGFGEHRPVATNDTPEGRAENRRIEIVLMPIDIGELVSELR